MATLTQVFLLVFLGPVLPSLSKSKLSFDFLAKSWQARMEFVHCRSKEKESRDKFLPILPHWYRMKSWIHWYLVEAVAGPVLLTSTWVILLRVALLLGGYSQLHREDVGNKMDHGVMEWLTVRSVEEFLFFLRAQFNLFVEGSSPLIPTMWIVWA